MSELLFTDYIAIDGLSWTEQRQVCSPVSVSAIGNTSQDGNKYIQVKNMWVAVSGRNAPRTIALGLWDSSLTLIGSTENFSVSASTEAVPTELKALQSPVLINTTSTASINAGFWSLGSQAVYYQKAEPSNFTDDIIYDSEATTQISNFTNSGILDVDKSLIGVLDYATVPSQIEFGQAYAGNTNATFIWFPPSDDGGSPITSYTVQRATNSTFTSGVVTLTGITDTRAVFTGLTNGTLYYFRVAAVNAVATAAGTTGPYSDIVGTGDQATPTSPARPGAPTNLEVFASPDITGIGGPGEPDELYITWTAPANNGATITSYSVSLAAGGEKGKIIETMTADPSLSVTGLIVNTIYAVTVSARNSVGLGPPSTTVFQTPVKLTYGDASAGLIKKYSSQYEAWIIVV
jgi:hypothetical protein